MGVSFRGVDKLINELERTIKNGKNQAVLIKAGNDVLRRAQTKAPADTGHLRRGITLKINGNKAIIRSNANYSGYVEYGTRYMEAQPYLRPAVEEVRPIFEKMLLEKLK